MADGRLDARRLGFLLHFACGRDEGAIWSRAVSCGYVRGWQDAAMAAVWLARHTGTAPLRVVSNFTARDELANLLDRNLARGIFLYWCPAHGNARNAHSRLQGRFYVDARWREKAKEQEKWTRLLARHHVLVVQDEARERGMFVAPNCAHFIVPCRGFNVPKGIEGNPRRKREFTDMCWALAHAKYSL